MTAGLSIHHGAQLVVDITLKSAVTSVGASRTTGATVNGAALTQAPRDKEAKYAELAQGRLVVVALETGGRRGRGPGVRDRLSGKGRTTGAARWTRMLSVSCARAFATFLGTGQSDAWSAPDLADLKREG